MAASTASSRRGSQEKSGKPWPRLTAPCSPASADMRVNTVVPTAGRRDCRTGVVMVRSGWMGWVSFYGGRRLGLDPGLGRHDAEQILARGAAGQLEQGLVLRDEDAGIGIARDLEEFLVVAV